MAPPNYCTTSSSKVAKQPSQRDHHHVCQYNVHFLKYCVLCQKKLPKSPTFQKVTLLSCESTEYFSKGLDDHQDVYVKRNGFGTLFRLIDVNYFVSHLFLNFM
ncbi:hypothetical protein ATANTOWER_032254 [Ataeniobius toweri]|uniref:Peptide-methionine (S)-S-oxide reductase n=1 Tax=Ataeniobius toweri TaxID=208326 RepID=A0ABU7A3W2_9TELE|nr:hypothetical protein [Ataeniobius toweri]